jgi:lantibiotic biosynthesis protein
VLSAARYLEQASALGDQLYREALWDGDRCSWGGAAVAWVDGGPQVVWRTVEADLYSGTSGIALFLASLFAATGDEKYRIAALGAMRQALSLQDAIVPSAVLGFYSGLTGVAFASETVGRLCLAAELAAEAVALARRLTNVDPTIHESDVLGGLAGAIAPLLILARRLSESDLQQLALRAGEVLLERAQKQRNGWSWPRYPNSHGLGLLGYSHGTAGIAASLIELFAYTADKRFLDAGEAAFAYERHWYDARQRNWPDLRNMAEQGGAPTFPIQWCHGAPGIGLARLRGFSVTGDEKLRDELEIAAISTMDDLATIDEPRRQGTSGVNYSLCHGIGGNADFLLQAGLTLGVKQWVVQAQLAGQVGIHRNSRTHDTWPCGVSGGGETPGLMLGLAGIGLFYLRLYNPVAVPSILLVDPSIA